MEKPKVDNAWGLYELIDDKFGNRFVSDYDWSLYGWVSGTIDSKRIRISFADEGNTLFISIDKDGEYLLEELIPFLTDIMANEDPICKFDLLRKCKDKYEEPVTTYLWNIDNPDKKLTELINKDLGYGAKWENLELLNGKEISDYQDFEDENKKGL